jgi:hypothetical protein
MMQTIQRELRKRETAPLTGNVWRGVILFSFAMNIILLLALLVALGFIFQIKNQIAQPLIGGLHSSFVEMNQASIQTTIGVNDTITVNDTIPVVFDLPLNQVTNVVTTEPVAIQGATVNLVSGGLTLRDATANIVLPAGTTLPVQLSLTVPVSQTVPVVLKVPVALNVPVDIPLNKTQLEPPFARLVNIVQPYNDMLNGVPSSWGELFTGQK